MSSWIFLNPTSGGGNSFTIMQPITGTAPTASSSSDTLTFVSGDGTVSIIGNSGTKQLDFRSAAAGVTSVALTMPNIYSVAGSPVTSSGTLAVTLATQSANKFWAGPTSGSAATPTFRSIVAADLAIGTYNAGNSGSSITIDWTNGLSQYVTLTASVVAITFSNPQSGCRHVLRMIQDATGARKAYIVGTNLNYALDQGLSNNATAGYSDIFVWDYDGTNYWGVRRITYDSNAVPDSWCVDQGSTNTTKYITVTDSSDFTLNTTGSISLWIYAYANTPAQYLVSHFNSGGTNAGFVFGIGVGTSTKLALFLSNSGTSVTASDTGAAVAVNTWLHIGVTWDGTSARFYQNGTKTSTISQTRSAVASSQNMVIGASTNSPIDAHFKGRLTQIGIWSSTLSDQAMADAWNNGRPRDLLNAHSASATLKLWHRTGNRADSTTTITDYSGLSHTGTPTAYVAADFISPGPQG